MQNETTFEQFMTGLAADRRVRRLVERGLLPADFSSKTPEVAVLLLAVHLADAEDRAGSVANEGIREFIVGVANENSGMQVIRTASRTT